VGSNEVSLNELLGVGARCEVREIETNGSCDTAVVSTLRHHLED